MGALPETAAEESVIEELSFPEVPLPEKVTSLPEETLPQEEPADFEAETTSSDFENALRSLSSIDNDYVSADLLMGLDNINLKESATAFEVLENLL